MEKPRSAFTATKTDRSSVDITTKLDDVSKKAPKKARAADCEASASTSHTKFFKKERYEDVYARLTRDEYLGIEESMSKSSDSFRCVHGSEGKQYSRKGLLKRNILKELDPHPVDRKWNDSCPPSYDWEIAKKLEFLIKDPLTLLQLGRFDNHLKDFARIAEDGYKIDVLDSLCVIVDYLVETFPKEPSLLEDLVLLIKNMAKPILLNKSSDIVTHFENLRDYLGFLGAVRQNFPNLTDESFERCVMNWFQHASTMFKRRYLLLRLEQDDLFELVSGALIWHLSAPDVLRGAGTVRLRHSLAAAAPVLTQSSVRMVAVTASFRFSTFMTIALLLACDSVENCIALLKENLLETVFYRFNPYFPERKLPAYDINPADPQDINVQLGDSSINISMTLSLILVLVTTLKQCTDKDPRFHEQLPCPDSYALRCFVWAYRYECRAREHRHERITLTVVASALVRAFGARLEAFSTELMPDVMSLSVLTELPFRPGWLRTVNFNTSQLDVQFKKVLIYLCIDLLRVFHYNSFMVESQHWLLGLMYLLDPGLSSLRARWSPALFAELRKTALQALVCALPITPPHVVKDYGLIRRIMWYVEWYSESPYELPVLYWCVRLLQVAFYQRGSAPRRDSLKDLFDTHGIIIVMHLCQTLLEQQVPPVEKRQVIIALALRLLTSALEAGARTECCVYPRERWPSSINTMARKMIDIVLHSLDNNFMISERWLISLLNFIWEGIVWNKQYRKWFMAHNGVYKLLDLITMTRAPVQCMALAVVCDAARAGDAVGQLVTWRASLGASHAHPLVVKRGATIASLLASVFRDECQNIGVRLNENGIIQDLDNPLRSTEVWNAMNNPNFHTPTHDRTPVCYAASDLAGSRMSKAFALLHLLSEDLHYKVLLTDEAYNLYKHIELPPEDETILVLCSHYLTAKLNEAWSEVQTQSPNLVPDDKDILGEFLHINKGWAVEIKQQQEDVIVKDRKKKYEEEYSLYEFLGRARLNTALDALREVRCTARAADRARITHAMLFEAVRAHHRRSMFARRIGAPVQRTYGPKLDDQNITGQNVKVYSIHPKNKPQPLKHSSSSDMGP